MYGHDGTSNNVAPATLYAISHTLQVSEEGVLSYNIYTDQQVMHTHTFLL